MRYEKVTLVYSGASHWPEEEKRDGYFYFECRDTEGIDFSIEPRVIANNIGSLEADRDIVADAIAAGITDAEYPRVYESDLNRLYKEIECH